MTSADFPRRVERTEHELTAVPDTVLDTEEVVDQHTETLAEIRSEVARVSSRLDTLDTQVAGGFAEILQRLGQRC